ncbi:MAG: sigma-70 family RNA polymerase sigma factor [Lewinellaceae bacterium]|nr:sigma-70 family RNA polymerase sigma factor [Saprospiraceae bacterium]MCB9340951.1 sigma-70 family RNA polymerase sigma factor [Lewinellaceae bacterium]
MTGNTNLFEALKTGDPAAFSQVYKTCYRSAASAVLNNGGTASDAEDLFQEALFVLVKNLQKPGFEIKAQVGTWLYSVVRNLWYKRLRDSGKELPVEDEKMKALADVPEENAIEIMENLREREAKYAHVIRAIEQTGEECREVILQAYYNEMPDDKIAEKLGYSYAFVRVKRHRCMGKLREILGI